MDSIELGIIPGFGCGFRCAHCAVSAESVRAQLSAEELELLVKTVRRHVPRTLAFTGGEPTHYVADINRIISAHPDPGRLKVRLTTNGHFAKDNESAAAMLRSFRKLDEVQLSYDKFHAEFLPFEHAGVLSRICAELSIKFGVLVALASPLDLAVQQDLLRLGEVAVSWHKVLPLGRAKKTGVAYQYPAFDAKVLGQSCPDKGQVFYIAGRGFSLCCSALVFDGAFPGTVHATLEEHMRSGFYRAMNSTTFSGLLAKRGVAASSLAPDHSSPCMLCKHIFSSKRSSADVPATQSN